jgi:sigma-B regulation protein RsbU (phosphoserine phosphatase)
LRRLPLNRFFNAHPFGATLLLSVTKQHVDTAGRNTRPERVRVLISDDQHDILTALSLLLKLSNFSTQTVDSPELAVEAARSGNFDLILMDLNYSRDTTSGKEGLELLSGLRAAGVNIPIVVMTAWGNVDLAVEAMRLGANDFIQKPWDNQRLLATVKNQIDRAESERRRISQARSELEIARHVQQKLLPQQPIPLAHLEYAASCLPAREVGGDFYDFFELGQGRMGGLLADVSGKGVAAAMLMASLQACFRTQLDSGSKNASELLSTINRLFYASSPPEQYATLFYFEFDDATRALRYVNCGHLAPAILRANGKTERLHSTATVIGLFPQCSCECHEIVLNEKDAMVLFTDGVTEFEDETGTEFGEDRFLELAHSARNLSPKSALNHVAERLMTARNGREQADDQTLAWLRAR